MVVFHISPSRCIKSTHSPEKWFDRSVPRRPARFPSFASDTGSPRATDVFHDGDADGRRPHLPTILRRKMPSSPPPKGTPRCRSPFPSDGVSGIPVLHPDLENDMIHEGGLLRIILIPQHTGEVDNFMESHQTLLL